MKNSIKSNVIIALLVLVVILLVANIRINKQLLKDYISFTESNLDEEVEDRPANKDVEDKDKDDQAKNPDRGSQEDEIENFNLQINYGQDKVSLVYKDGQAEFVDNHMGKVLNKDEANDLFNNTIKKIDFNVPESQLVDILLYELNLPTDFNKIDLKIQYADQQTLEYNIEN